MNYLGNELYSTIIRFLFINESGSLL